jgi:hypothetical protein
MRHRIVAGGRVQTAEIDGDDVGFLAGEVFLQFADETVLEKIAI